MDTTPATLAPLATHFATAVHRLYDPKATRSGRIHYWTFLVYPAHVVAVADDCVGDRVHNLTAEAARDQYRACVAAGFQPIDAGRCNAITTDARGRMTLVGKPARSF